MIKDKGNELIDSHVSTKQCKKAINALYSHALKVQAENEEHELLGEKDQNVWLTVGVKMIYPEKKLKPHKIPIAHPIIDPRTTSICLITKDPQREYKDLLESHGIRFISRVVGIAKLKGKWKPFEARRALLKENGMFLADERVVPLLPKLLGTKWFEAKKQPIPVCLTRKDLKSELERAVSSTYMHLNRGTSTAIKIGTVSHTPEQILANLKTALPVIVKNIRDGWDNIQNLMIKTSTSVSLPIWTCDLGEGKEGRWNGLVAEIGEGDEDVSEAEEKANEVVMENKSKGKRRVSEVAEDKDEGAGIQKKKAKKGTVKAIAAVAITATTPAPAKPSEKIDKVSETKVPKPSIVVPAPPPPPPKKDELKKKLSKTTNETKLKGKSSLSKSAKAKLLGKKALD